MAYIGKTPVLGNFVKLDAISVVNGQAAYTMQNGGVNFTSYDNVNQFLVSLNGILQSPTDSFTVSGSTLTFASNLSTGDVIDFVMVLGNTLDVGTPSDNTVSLAKLTATGTKDATTFLRGDNTFAGAGITNAQQWRISASQTSMDSGDHITNNWEEVDTDGYGRIGNVMTQSSGIFTFPSTGIWLIEFVLNSFGGNQDNSYIGGVITSTTDNSSYSEAVIGFNSSQANQYTNCTLNFMFDVTNTSTHKIRFAITSANNGVQAIGETAKTRTGATFIRLGDT